MGTGQLAHAEADDAVDVRVGVDQRAPSARAAVDSAAGAAQLALRRRLRGTILGGSFRLAAD